MRRIRGFTIIELLVALAILAIVSALAIPIYTQYSIRTFRADAQKDLLLCGQGLERLASQTFTYANHVDTDADGAGDADTGPVSVNICTPSSFNYALTVQAADANTFTVRATPAGGPVVGDGALEADASGARRWDKNNNGDFTDAGDDDWHD
ncbi:MAG: prepilin-type N-terminal cleavage/methylation domain-containing protein [Gammaproteobacteria bacterium]|nr:prepilin-type N-terminal cleavage/methylation domain-containing protein [Gammaproteobacteria bacterium]